MKKVVQYVTIVTILFSFTGQSCAEYEAELEDILIVSVSGYTYINYDISYVYTEYDYAKLLANTLVKDLRQARSEAEANKQILQQASGTLDSDLKDIYDSLKNGSSFDDYKIISALLLKYSDNRDDIYFHIYFREEHPGCFGIAGINPNCENLKTDYIFDEETPINGRVIRGLEDTASQIDCRELMHILLPTTANSAEKDQYLSFANKVCADLTPLKSCLAEVTEIDSDSGAVRRMKAAPVAAKNSIFDKFRTREAIKR